MTYIQCEDSKVRKNTLVLFLFSEVSTQDAQVFSAVLKPDGIPIPSFSDPPAWK